MRVLALPGDGIGPEIMDSALAVIDALQKRHGLKISYEKGLIGGAAIDAGKPPLPAETLTQARQSDAVLLAAVGGPRWDALPSKEKPEAGLLKIRSELGLFANLRPVQFIRELKDISPFKEEVVTHANLLIVRELTGGLYFGEPRGLDESAQKAWNTMTYQKSEIERIAHVAFELAQKRSKKVTSVDKANVLEVSRYWRKTVTEVGKLYPDVILEHMYVDNCALQLMLSPKQFDVILTENLFGDILSDEGAAIVGSLGLLPSASLSGLRGSSEKCRGLFEPVHGSAPSLAGKDEANPIGMLLSTAMMLRFTHPDSKMGEENAQKIESALHQVLEKGFRTRDLSDDKTPAEKIIKTSQLTEEVLKNL